MGIPGWAWGRAIVDSAKEGGEKMLRAERAVCAKIQRWKKMTAEKQPMCFLQGCTSQGDFGSKTLKLVQIKIWGYHKDTKGSWSPKTIQPGFRELITRGQTVNTFQPSPMGYIVSYLHSFLPYLFLSLSLFFDFQGGHQPITLLNLSIQP